MRVPHYRWRCRIALARSSAFFYGPIRWPRRCHLHFTRGILSRSHLRQQLRDRKAFRFVPVFPAKLCSVPYNARIFAAIVDVVPSFRARSMILIAISRRRFIPLSSTDSADLLGLVSFFWDQIPNLRESFQSNFARSVDEFLALRSWVNQLLISN